MSKTGSIPHSLAFLILLLITGWMLNVKVGAVEGPRASSMRYSDELIMSDRNFNSKVSMRRMPGQMANYLFRFREPYSDYDGVVEQYERIVQEPYPIKEEKAEFEKEYKSSIASLGYAVDKAIKYWKNEKKYSELYRPLALYKWSMGKDYPNKKSVVSLYKKMIGKPYPDEIEKEWINKFNDDGDGGEQTVGNEHPSKEVHYWRLKRR